MDFSTSLKRKKIRRTFLVSFSLSFLLPLFILIFVTFKFIMPLINQEQIFRFNDAISLGLIVVIPISLLGYFLMSNLIGSVEKLTQEVHSKNGLNSNTYKKPKETNEIDQLIDSFDSIYSKASESLNECRRLREQLSLFVSISANLTSELDFDRLFPLIIAKVTEAMKAERTSLYVIDWDKNEIWTKVAEGVGEIHLTIGSGISGKVAESGETINVKDAWDLPYFDRKFDHKNQFRTKSVLCMPVQNIRRERIGVLQVINKIGEERFGDVDERLMKGLVSQVGIALENTILMDELLRSFNSSIKTLSAVVDARHPLTAGHSQRVTEYSMMVAKKMEIDENDSENLKIAALLHDIGKIGISDRVLLKSGQYTSAERAEMNTHTIKTKTILDNFRFPRTMREVPFIACHHHEKIDGTGYPDGLTGDELHLGSKILAVADVFDALTSLRDYPKYSATGEKMSSNPMPISKVISILKTDSGTHFDPTVVEAFMSCLPQMLVTFRGSHFAPEYVDDTIESLSRRFAA